MTTESNESTSANQRKTYTPEQKLKIVLESMRTDTTIEAVRVKYGVAASALHRWRDDFKNNQASIAESAFGDKRSPKTKAKLAGFAPGQSPDELKKIIGEQTVQIEILKKVQGLLN
jgi:transposase-like protein